MHQTQDIPLGTDLRTEQLPITTLVEYEARESSVKDGLYKASCLGRS